MRHSRSIYSMNDAESAPTYSIADINWEARTYLGHGIEGVVYRVALGVAAKVGGTSRGSVDAQRLFHDLGLALPVLDFSGGMHISTDVACELCKQHGYARNLVASRHFECSCHNTYVPVLLTPEALPLTEEERRSKEVRNFRRRLRRRLSKHNVVWDSDNPNNVMRFQGRLVAIDF